MKYILLIFGVIAGYFVLGYTLVALNIVALPLFKLGSKVQMNYGVIEKTYNPDNAIYNYEWFKQKYEDIQANKTKINNAQLTLDNFELSSGSRDKWTFEDKNEDARLQTIVLGLKNHQEDLVADYNARAKMANRNIFSDKLPMFVGLE
jgi:hypothetical protein